MSDASNAEYTQASGSGTKPTSSRQTLSVIALLFALLALLAASWTGWQVRALSQLPARISMDSSRLADLTRQTQTLVSISNRQKQQLADLAISLEDGLAVLPEMANRMQQSEQQLASLPAMDSSSRKAWLKAEALNYLQIAITQATLARNPQIAASALQLADDKLRDTGDPALAEVRAQLTKDLAALQALPQIDRAGISFRLQAIANQIQTWPFQGSAPERFAPATRSAAEVPGQPAWQRFVAMSKSVFSSMVSIKQIDAQPLAQLGSAERALIIAGIQAELQLARLALAANDADSFRQSLLQVSGQVKQSFDPDDSAVVAALETLEALQGTELPGSLPDISGALTLMLSASANDAPATVSDGT